MRLTAVFQEMVLLEPKFEEAFCDGAGAFVALLPPGPHNLLNLLTQLD
ncbi:MAG: hypothetical protein Q8Q12_06550 [bacterium]|nr:hypothetical protein [bacterium]